MGNKKAFTLIELLAVTIIIAILASVGVAEYQKVIMRTKATESLTFAGTLMHAEQRYLLKNGSYSVDPAKLDIGYPVVSQQVFEGDAQRTVVFNKFVASFRDYGAQVVVVSYTNPYYEIRAGEGGIFCVSDDPVKGNNLCESIGGVSSTPDVAWAEFRIE